MKFQLKKMVSIQMSQCHPIQCIKKLITPVTSYPSLISWSHNLTYIRYCKLRKWDTSKWSVSFFLPFFLIWMISKREFVPHCWLSPYFLKNWRDPGVITKPYPHTQVERIIAVRGIKEIKAFTANFMKSYLYF